MKAVRLEKFVNEYHEIKISEVPKPQVKDGEVVIRVIAAGVNFVDLLYARGKHQNNRSLIVPPFTLGLEFAGVIVSAPPNSLYRAGDRVYGSSIGSYAEYVAVRPSSIRLIPPSWTFTSAAGLAATAPVSYGALILRGQLKEGETVLIHAAAGGLGLMAVQIAKAIGARVIATAGSREKLAVARRFGADEIINYNDGEWWEEVLKLTNGEGVNVVYDSVGLVDMSLKCLKHKGRVLVVGFAGSDGKIESVAMNRVLLKQAQIIGYRFGETDRRDPSETAKAWRSLEEMIGKGLLRPTVFGKEYRGLESVVSAMRDLASRKVWGKAVVLVKPEQCKSRL